MPVLAPPGARFPIGLSDYVMLRRGGYTYVDKTRFVADVLDSGAVVTLFPRPRRFGKTLNQTTLQAFLERSQDDLTGLFADTEVWHADGGRHRAHFQRHPVIALSFKEARARTWDDAWVRIRGLLVAEAIRLRNAGLLQTDAHGDLERFTHDEGGPNRFIRFLAVLSSAAQAATGQPVVILIDEYDAPLHAAWEHGYWPDAIEFFRDFLTGGLKDNRHLFRGVLTGILRVAKENVFSGLNNIDILSIFSQRGATSFGFTEGEVDDLAALAGVSHLREDLRAWYDGYRFGHVDPQTLYNPWSILKFLDRPEEGLQSFWKNTSANTLIHQLLVRHAAEIGADVTTLLQGGTVRAVLDENVALQDLDRGRDILWSLLTFSGYLTPASVTLEDARFHAELRIPNRETATIFEDSFTRFIDAAGPRDAIPHLARALLTGDDAIAEEILETLLSNAMSHHDFVGSQVEAVYQAFIVGLLLRLDATHRVTSNREAGHGRADVLITPRVPGPGAVLELKVVGRRETPETAMDSAVAQLRDRRYDREVLAAGATAVWQYGVVFDGKRCQVTRLD